MAWLGEEQSYSGDRGAVATPWRAQVEVVVATLGFRRGEIEEKGLGWTAWLLNRAVASFDEATMRESLERWVWSRTSRTWTTCPLPARHW